MHLSTLARDCLYVNWALPKSAAPELPSPLTYEAHESNDEEWVFASVLLFRLSGLHLPALPIARFSYPQMNLRLYVLDGRGLPSVLFLRTLVPFWVAPMSRLFGRQPVTAATFSYPSPSDDPDAGGWEWSVRRHRRLEIRGRMASPADGPGPRLGSWQATVEYFRNRRRGYAMWDNRLRAIRTSNAAAAIWPLEVEIGDAGLVSESLAGVADEVWQAPHSAWLCPQIPFRFELGEHIQLPVPSRGLPAAGGLSSSATRTAGGPAHLAAGTGIRAAAPRASSARERAICARS